ncbi:MAG TPA: acyl-CoA dehydrogenase family protein, partial [Mycobacterium sp.]|nr:acyl-CoA dehydrogenase family protein [Mycobacterium sp.]
GQQTAALALTWSAAPDPVIPSVRVVDGRLSGTITSVAGALEADLLLIPASTPDGIAVYAVDARAVILTPVVSLDMTRQLANVTLDGTTATMVNPDAGAAIRRALEVGAALLASEQLGVARWCLDTTVGYLKERRQFGRIVGGYQALKHRLADLYTGVESAAAAARYAAATLAAGDPDAPVAAAIAQAFCGDLAVTAAEEAVQLHGGIGMTWEHPAHLYLKRAKADQIALGTPGRHRARLGELVNLPR